jgi:hypothetical protein
MKVNTFLAIGIIVTIYVAGFGIYVMIKRRRPKEVVDLDNVVFLDGSKFDVGR